jgi:glycosyltransferase involved in cell wall biosynthesis
MLLPNSNNEYRRLSSAYNINRAYRPIPNGIDISLFDFDKNMLRQENLVICVGRIEGRKNQLNLIKALSNTEFQLIIIGSAAANQAKYFKECIDAAGENVIFVDNLPQDKLLDYYRKAKVHVLASWFETTGLSSLEAGVMGCNIVITDKGDTKEYFEDLAYYCIPDSIDSIYSAVRAASVNPYKEELRTRIIQNYTWDIAANKTLEAYNIVLGNQ